MTIYGNWHGSSPSKRNIATLADISAGNSREQTGTCRANNQWQLTRDEYLVHGWLLCSFRVPVTPVLLLATSVNVRDPKDNELGRSGRIPACQHLIMTVKGGCR